jgi:outer membrane lipoprotein
MRKNRRYELLALGVLLLGGCASAPPEIREAPPVNPDVSQVGLHPDQHSGQIARWGGLILETENRAEVTAITVLALPLNKSGKPQSADASPGRFIALVPHFLEPTLYAKERKFTVKGLISGTETRKVGEFPYHYPVIQVEHYYLWPVEPVLSEEDRYPWWRYDPWYYPWYPNYYPYWRYR